MLWEEQVDFGLSGISLQIILFGDADVLQYTNAMDLLNKFILCDQIVAKSQFCENIVVNRNSRF